MDETQIILIRHAETVWNREKRIQGHRDAPLSEEGVAQCRKLKARLAGLPFDAVYSSDSERALRSAQISLEGRPLPIQTSAGLREQNYGDWEGRLWQDLKNDALSGAGDFLKNPAQFTPPGGEAWNQMQDRVFQFVRQVVEKNEGKRVLIFSHGGSIRGALFAALGVPGDNWRRWIIGNTSLQTLIYERPAGVWKLAGFNDSHHLNIAVNLSDPST